MNAKRDNAHFVPPRCEIAWQLACPELNFTQVNVMRVPANGLAGCVVPDQHR